jgi:ppGpp synthetase/RelA/SpoT-type nucleotidyltranferase
MKVKTSKQIKKELERYSDFANAYSDAIEALEAFEKKSIEFRRGKSVKKATSHENTVNSRVKSMGCKCGKFVGNHSLREEKLPTQSDDEKFKAKFYYPADIAKHDKLRDEFMVLIAKK